MKMTPETTHQELQDFLKLNDLALSFTSPVENIEKKKEIHAHGTRIQTQSETERGGLRRNSNRAVDRTACFVLFLFFLFCGECVCVCECVFCVLDGELIRACLGLQSSLLRNSSSSFSGSLPFSSCCLLLLYCAV